MMTLEDKVNSLLRGLEGLAESIGTIDKYLSEQNTINKAYGAAIRQLQKEYNSDATAEEKG